jgi:aminopeptidase N
MDAWINRKGFPLVSLSEHTDDDHNYADDHHELYVIDQTTFAAAKSCGDESTTSTTGWRVPVRLAALAHDDSREERFFLLEQPRQVVKLPRKPGGYRHVKLNAGHKGYYRTTYSSLLAERLFANISRCGACGACRAMQRVCGY